jgi:hypothetical protein
MGGYNHEFPKNGSGIFLPQGLDTSGKSVIRVLDLRCSFFRLTCAARCIHYSRRTLVNEASVSWPTHQA